MASVTDNKRRALGKGLDSLLPRVQAPAATTPTPPSEQEGGKPREIAVDLIDRNPFQTRSTFDDAQLGELAASIAHEINQPLAAVATSGNACLRWLGRDPPDLDAARQTVARIVQDAHRAGDVIRSLRGLAVKSGPQFTSLDLEGAIQEVLALTRSNLQRHGVELHMELYAALPQVLGDKVQLQQVLLNLITNAVDAMSEITDRPRTLTITADPAQPDGVLIGVEDTGKGFDPTAADQIFAPFYTTKSSGMGMGLSICKTIIEAHGGQLRAKPSLPHGAIFQFRLPAEGREVGRSV